MRILVTNDDGIDAPGLQILEGIARDLAGPDGEIWVVAPASEQSGVAHCLTCYRPVLIDARAPRRWTVEGTPADCVIVALHQIMEHKPDLILSGVNKGNNSAENAISSGTIGAAMEGSLQGIPAIALSQYFGPGNHDAADRFEGALTYGRRAVEVCLEAGFDLASRYPLFYNVNFPPCLAADIRGMAATPQGRRPDVAFSSTSFRSPAGRTFVWLGTQEGQQRPSEPGSDAEQNLAGIISITPMRVDLTDYAALDTLGKISMGIEK